MTETCDSGFAASDLPCLKVGAPEYVSALKGIRALLCRPDVRALLHRLAGQHDQPGDDADGELKVTRVS